MGNLTFRQVIERERECVARQQCDRNCAQCDLVMEADDILAAYDHALDFLEVEEKTGMTPEDAATIGRFQEHIFSQWSYSRMAEIAQAEHDGRLVVLPCKVGDTVFWADRGIKSGEIVELTIDEFLVDKHGAMAVFNRVDPKRHRLCAFYLENFGKRLFLTREGAEATLKRGDSEDA